MKELWSLIINKLKENKIYGYIIAITAFLDCVNKLFTILHNFPSSRIFYLVLIVSIFLVFRKILREIEMSQTSKKLIKLVKVCKVLIYLVFIIPIYWGIKYYYDKKAEQETCAENQKKVGVLVANFSKQNNGNTDPFSSTLYGKLNSELQNSDTINVCPVSKYISEYNSSYIDQIKEIFQNNCSNKGLIVFGNRVDQNSFNCRIYSLGFLDFLGTEYYKTTNKTIIYIQNPNTINFTIEYEASTISKFIYGLLYLHAGNYELSNKYIANALALNSNRDNVQFISLCHFFMGNNFIKLHQADSAINEYQAGTAIDSANENMHYNLAAIYDSNGKIEKAYAEYAIAHQLNNKLKNPLHKIITLTKSPKPSHLEKPHFKFKLIDSLKAKVKIDTTKKNIIKESWNEQCYTIFFNQKYGVVNNKKDTIIKCLYDGIESYPYKNADCFIVKLNNKYGAFVHVHYDNGYTVHVFPLEYSERSIREAVVYCIDNH